jgi:hypothetical protein
MDILNPQKDAAALSTVVQTAEDKGTDELVNRILPAASEALKNALDGLTVTITLTISKKVS